MGVAKDESTPNPEREIGVNSDAPDIGTISDQSTDSLFTANGPPAVRAGSSDTLLFAAAGPDTSDLLSNIESVLNQYANSIIDGEQVFTFTDQDLGGVLRMLEWQPSDIARLR